MVVAWQRSGYSCPLLCSVFTDGVGQCNAHIARIAAKMVGYDHTPSAIHVRINGGTKGVLSVVHDIGPDEVRRRESQIKFPSENRTISVIKAGSYLLLRVF